MKNCKFCETQFESRDSRRLFCSRSCSAKYSNKFGNRPKSQNRRPCATGCGREVRNKGTVHCLLCKSRIRHEQAGALRKSEVSRERISAHARRVLKQSLASCLVCGYSFAVEAAHIRPVKSFSENTLVSDMNKEDNLLPLCPNHHLEFDRGKLSLEQVLWTRSLTAKVPLS